MWEMDPYEAVDIDEEKDFRMAEASAPQHAAPVLTLRTATRIRLRSELVQIPTGGGVLDGAAVELDSFPHNSEHPFHVVDVWVVPLGACSEVAGIEMIDVIVPGALQIELGAGSKTVRPTLDHRLRDRIRGIDPNDIDLPETKIEGLLYRRHQYGRTAWNSFRYVGLKLVGKPRPHPAAVVPVGGVIGRQHAAKTVRDELRDSIEFREGAGLAAARPANQ